METSLGPTVSWRKQYQELTNQSSKGELSHCGFKKALTLLIPGEEKKSSTAVHDS